MLSDGRSLWSLAALGSLAVLSGFERPFMIYPSNAGSNTTHNISWHVLTGASYRPHSVFFSSLGQISEKQVKLCRSNELDFDFVNAGRSCPGYPSAELGR